MICLASPLQYLQSLPRQSIPKHIGCLLHWHLQLLHQATSEYKHAVAEAYGSEDSEYEIPGFLVDSCAHRLSVSDDPRNLEAASKCNLDMNQVQPGHIACSHCKPGSLSSSKFRSPAESTYLLASHVSWQ